MRALLLLLIPLIWAFAAYAVSLITNEVRRARQGPRTIEGEWRDAADTRAAAYPRGRRRALCGRHNLHLVLRLAFAEGSCKHCAEIREELRHHDAEEAVRAAERHISGRTGDEPL